MELLQEMFRTAVQSHQEGRIEQAAELYDHILRHQPGHAASWHLLGVVRQQRGDPGQAVTHILQAIQLDGSRAIYHNNLGVALRDQGRVEEAVAAYRRALAINPNYADAHANLAVALHEAGRHDDALDSFRSALQTCPDHPDALANLGNLYHDLGQHGEAIRAFQRSLAIRPDRAGVHNNLGNALLAERRVSEAITCYQEALAVDRGHAEAYLNLGVAYAEQDRVEEAAQYYEAAGRLQPSKVLWKMRPAGLCPVIFPDVAALDSYRVELEARLDGYQGWPLEVDWKELPAKGFTPSFNLAHHGRDNRPILEKFAALFDRYIPRRRPSPGTGRPRIGFLVTRGHEGGFLRGTSGIIQHLDRGRFEPVVLCSEAAMAACRSGLRQADVRLVPFPDRFSQAVERIAAEQCDVLYHWQIGTDPLNYFLPFARLAPVQCTSWGTHGTTGIATVDDYLSSRLIEADGADEHYTETLHRFDAFPTYQPRITQPGRANRSDFGLPSTGSFYLCPQRLAKFHPDADALLRGVLEADSDGFLVILEGNQSHGYELLRRRFRRTLPGVLDRVIFLPAQPPRDFYRLLSLADALLDMPHYSVGLMGYDAFALNVPVVTLPNAFNLGRYAHGFYKLMNLDNLIASSPEEYIALAVRLGADRDYREAIRKQIAERSPTLFEDLRSVRQHEDFFEVAVRRARES